MPRRKSLIAQMYEAHQKVKLQRQKLEEQASRAWAEHERKEAAQAAKEAAQQRREEERAAQARVREEQQAERAAAQQERERERQAAAEVREQERRAAEERREQQRQEVEQRRLTAERRAAEAEFRTEAVHAKIAAFDRLLLDRNRNLARCSWRAEDAFNAHGPEAFVAAVQQGLATSVCPDGLAGSCAAQYVPESAELWVEYGIVGVEAVHALVGVMEDRWRPQFSARSGTKVARLSWAVQKLKLNCDFMLYVPGVTSPVSTSRLLCDPDTVRATLPAV